MKLAVCVVYNAINISNISRCQLQSAAKALKLNPKSREKSDLVKSLGEALITQGYIKVLEGCGEKVSRDNIKKLKPF